jgi:F0F1-type ATP synthase assembly protein I
MSTDSSNNETEIKKKKVEIQGTYRDYAPYLTLGFQLAAAVVLFFLLGHWIDNRFGIAPIGKLIGVLIGSIGGFVKFFKTVAMLATDKEKQQANKKHEN